MAASETISNTTATLEWHSGEDQRHQQRNDQIALEALHDQLEDRRAFDFRQCGAEHVQGQEHQPQADQCTTDAFVARVIAQPKDDQARQQNAGREHRHIDAEQLHHQG